MQTPARYFSQYSFQIHWFSALSSLLAELALTATFYSFHFHLKFLYSESEILKAGVARERPSYVSIELKSHQIRVESLPRFLVGNPIII